MALDPSSFWAGWEHWARRAKAMLQVTTKTGDYGTSSSDAAGVGWADVVALTDGVADSAPLGSLLNPAKVTLVDGTATALAYSSLSGTITAGGTAQNLVAAASGDMLVELSNPSSATESLWFNDTAAATGSPNVDQELQPGQTYLWSNGGPVPVPTTAISIFAATTGHHYRAKKG